MASHCDDIERALTPSTTSRSTSYECQSTACPDGASGGAHTRDLLRQIAVENELHIISGKVATSHPRSAIRWRWSREPRRNRSNGHQR